MEERRLPDSPRPAGRLLWRPAQRQPPAIKGHLAGETLRRASWSSQPTHPPQTVCWVDTKRRMQTNWHTALLHPCQPLRLALLQCSHPARSPLGQAR